MDLNAKKYSLISGANSLDPNMQFMLNHKQDIKLMNTIGKWNKKTNTINNVSINGIIKFEKAMLDPTSQLIIPTTLIHKYSQHAYEYAYSIKQAYSIRTQQFIHNPAKELNHRDVVKEYVNPKRISKVIKSDVQLMNASKYIISHYIIIADYKNRETDKEDKFSSICSLTMGTKNKSNRLYIDPKRNTTAPRWMTLKPKDSKENGELTTDQKKKLIQTNVLPKDIVHKQGSKFLVNHKFGFSAKEATNWFNTYNQYPHKAPTTHTPFVISMEYTGWMKTEFVKDCFQIADAISDLDDFAQCTHYESLNMTKLIKHRIDDMNDMEN